MSFKDDCRLAAAALEAFAEEGRLRMRPVIRQPPMDTLARELELDRLMHDGGLTGEVLKRFLAAYLSASTSLRHPGYMAHQVAVPHEASAVAALVDGFSNNAMAIYEMGPAAATIEHFVLNWMLAKAGWRPAPLPGSPGAGDGLSGAVHGGGVLTHGGSLANLTVLLAARSRIAPTAWTEGTPGNLVIVASPVCHYSIARAAGILGLGQAAVRHAPTDAEGRLDSTRLAAFIASLRSEGRKVLAVIANACSTALGLYDPIGDIAAVCREHDVWLHVDGAHGASALVSERHRHLLDGLELAESLVWDAHKMLRTPTLCAAVLVRDHRTLDNAFREDASYLFHDKDEPGFDFIHRTVECTKAALGLRVFFALAADGEAAIADYIDRQCALAKAAAARLRAEPGFEVAVEPESNIICFRLEGSDPRQLALRKRLTEEGDFYISTTEALGRRWLRLALMNPVTGLDDIEALIARLRTLARALAETTASP